MIRCISDNEISWQVIEKVGKIPFESSTSAGNGDSKSKALTGVENPHFEKISEWILEYFEVVKEASLDMCSC